MAFVCVVCGVLTMSTPSFAEEPTQVSATATDLTGTISSDIPQIEDALVALQRNTDKSLRVVFVDSFEGASSDQWAHESFTRSGFGEQDALLAISLNTNQLSVWTGGGGFTVSELRDAISGDVTSQWHDGAWVGGFTTLASNLDGSSGSSSAAPFILLITVVVGGLALVVWIVFRRKFAAKKLASQVAQLERQASVALLEADDGVRASGNELDFARADFGLEATQEFADVLDEARTFVQRAFEIRKQLDDEIPETPEQKLEMNSQIVQLAQSAQASITKQEESFSQLRNLAATVVEHLDNQEARINELSAQLENSKAQLDSLALTYPETALVTFRTYPDQVRVLLEAAHKHIAEGRTVAATNQPHAVPYLRLVEDAVNQARGLVEQLANVRATFEQAQARLGDAIRSIGFDIADANRLGEGDPVITSRKRAGEAAVTLASTPPVDPIKALDALTSAENALDGALAGVRTADENLQRARALVERNRQAAQTAINEADVTIDRYGKYLPSSSRTLVASAKQSYSQATQSKEPIEQAQLFEQARMRASQASSQANTALSQENDPFRSNGSGMGAVLGGMIIGSLLSGGGNRSTGGFSSGSFGGGGGSRGGGFGGSF